MTGGRIRRDIIDNAAGSITMQKVLLSEIPHAKRFDVSTGYFNVEGYGLLREQLEAAVRNGSFQWRLLLGSGAMAPSGGILEGRAERHMEEAGGGELVPVRARLDAADLDSSSYSDTLSLIALLRRRNVEVRLGPGRFNHSKCYILGDNSVFIGSSNMTAGGLVGNSELNAGLYQPGVAAETRRWFDRMWESAADAKGALILALEQSKFGMPAEPHDVYMKMLFETYRHLLKPRGGARRGPRRGSVELAEFQRDAVAASMHVVGSLGGAIIADSTGLGKTSMAIEIMRLKSLDEGKKTLLVAPAQVLKSVWEEALDDADVPVRRRVTMESVSGDGFLEDLGAYRNIEFVVVDESQNFRSKNAKRRQNLMKMLSVGRKKQVLLLTATPINNSLMDLYYQISLITQGNDGYFWDDVGIVDLRAHMRDAARKDLREGLDKIEHLLDSIMIRRTRSFIRDVYGHDEIDGRPITFPRHEYRPIRYDLAGLYGNIFGRLFRDINSLTMAPYGLENYNTSLPESKRKEHRALASLQVVMLLKRFESSTAAVGASIDNKIRMYEHVELMLRQGRILRVREFNDALRQWRSQEMDGEDDGGDMPEAALVDTVRRMATEKAGPEYDTGAMLSDVRFDLRVLGGLRKAIKEASVDKKFEAVRDEIIADGALGKEGRKVLIFTEYTDTAKHLHRMMCDAFADREVLLIHGGTDDKSRQDCIRRFAPRANLPKGEALGKREADMLISTEVLSEGQNLQDCNYVVNYDLPWNPMRIVQRTGRIDRLTSRHKVVHSRACYPDKQLDDLLQLVGKIMGKIELVSKVVGTDSEILDKVPNPKEYNGRLASDIRAMAGMGGGADVVARRLEEESDVMPKTTALGEAMRHVKEIGFAAMDSAPMGRRSGLSGKGQKAVLAYLEEGRRTRRVHFAVYDYKTGRAGAVDDAEGLRLASCARGAPLHLPMDGPENRESFEELLRIDRAARKALLDRDRSGRKIAEALRKKRQHGDADVSGLQEALVDAVGGGRLPPEDADAALEMLKSPQIRSWPGRLRDLLAAYRRDGDAAGLVRSLRRLGDSIYVVDRPAQGSAGAAGPTAAGGAARYRLVGAMFVMGQFDPRLGQDKMDRHMG